MLKIYSDTLSVHPCHINTVTIVPRKLDNLIGRLLNETAIHCQCLIRVDGQLRHVTTSKGKKMSHLLQTVFQLTSTQITLNNNEFA
jgi:hypothetical protein